MPFPAVVEPLAELPAQEQARTARHAMLAGFGELGQRRLAAAHVAVVGAGGLGSPVVLALTAAGIDTLTVIDDDTVELSNLQRQVLHRTTDLGAPKVRSAIRVASELSPETRVNAVQERLTAANAVALFTGADLVIDGSDTFDTRVLVAAASEELGIPLVWGVVQEFHAQVTVFWNAPPAGHSAVVLNDLYPAESVGDVPSCAQVGVLGALCMQAGSLMAVEAIKLITGTGEPLFGRVAVLDALRGTQREVPLRGAGASAEMSGCAVRASAVSSGVAGETSGGGIEAPGITAESPHPAAIPQLTPSQTRDAVSAGAILIDVREPFETTADHIPGSLLIPLAELLAAPSGAGTGTVVVVCKSGGRAQRAAAALRAEGVNVAVLAGGIDAWNSEKARA